MSDSCDDSYDNGYVGYDGDSCDSDHDDDVAWELAMKYNQCCFPTEIMNKDNNNDTYN